MKLNGRLTLGENVADNGGLRLGWMALMWAQGCGTGAKMVNAPMCRAW